MKTVFMGLLVAVLVMTGSVCAEDTKKAATTSGQLNTQSKPIDEGMKEAGEKADTSMKSSKKPPKKATEKVGGATGERKP